MGQGPDTAKVMLIKSYLISKKGLIPFCRPEFKQDADDKLSSIRSRDYSGKELLFVGLHVRRGDYVEFGRQVTTNDKRKDDEDMTLRCWVLRRWVQATSWRQPITS